MNYMYLNSLLYHGETWILYVDFAELNAALYVARGRTLKYFIFPSGDRTHKHFTYSQTSQLDTLGSQVPSDYRV